MSHNSSSDRNAVSSQLQRAKLDYKGHLDDIGNAYNVLEERVYQIETTIPTQVQQLERQIQPYEEYKKAAQDALKKIKEYSQKIEADRTAETQNNDQINAKIDDLASTDSDRRKALDDLEKNIGRLTKSIDNNFESLSKKIQFLDAQFRKTEALQSDHAETTALVQLLLKRVQTLENGASSQSASTSTQRMSAQELVDALLDRVKNGEALDETAAARLRPLITESGSVNSHGSTLYSNRVPYTPSTESDRATQMEDRAQDSIRRFMSQSVDQGKTQSTTRPHDSPAQRTRGRRQPDFSGQPNEASQSTSKNIRNNKEEAEEQDAANEAAASKKATRKRKRDVETAGEENEPEHDRPTRSSVQSAASTIKRSRPRKSAKLSPKKRAVQSPAPPENDEEEEEDEDEDEEEEPQIRRTSRVFKPTPRGEQFMTWLEVKNQSRGR